MHFLGGTPQINARCSPVDVFHVWLPFQIPQPFVQAAWSLLPPQGEECAEWRTTQGRPVHQINREGWARRKSEPQTPSLGNFHLNVTCCSNERYECPVGSGETDPCWTDPIIYSERQHHIMRHVHSSGFVSIDQLAEQYNVSPQTIRRDVNLLTEAGEIRRVHGGVDIPVQSRNLLYAHRSALPSGRQAMYRSIGRGPYRRWCLFGGFNRNNARAGGRCFGRQIRPQHLYQQPECSISGLSAS